ncbi:hypothetical protein [Desulfosarcina ovata]|uniref:hypothetical protein n=1 Tax=Desulfosarcina ovata TaxID=83564 RepID=UPI0012D2FDA2|nr:hypothetical protein [Desulfosarcina ovata]
MITHFLKPAACRPVSPWRDRLAGHFPCGPKGKSKTVDKALNEQQRPVGIERTVSGTGRRYHEEGVPVMAQKMEIVFFDDLGFGWLMDAGQIERLREKQTIEEILIQRSLAELLGKTKLI